MVGTPHQPLPITVAPLFNAELSANGPCFNEGVGGGVCDMDAGGEGIWGRREGFVEESLAEDMM
jgi:hypothetical protein